MLYSLCDVFEFQLTFRLVNWRLKCMVRGEKEKVGGQMKVNFSRLEIARASQKTKKRASVLLFFFIIIVLDSDTHTHQEMDPC